MQHLGHSDREGTSGLVLCGGASRRMGRDKALLPYGDGTLLDHALERLDALSDDVRLATGATERYADRGRALVLDPEPDQGPLAGLVAGLTHARHDWLVVLAVDVPRLGVEALADLLARARAADADVTVYATEAGPPPLVGVYHRRSLPAFRAALVCGRRRMVDGWDEPLPDGRALRVQRVACVPEALENWNQPDDVPGMEVPR